MIFSSSFWRTLVLTLALIAGLSLLAGPAFAAPAAPGAGAGARPTLEVGASPVASPTCGPVWSAVPGPNASSRDHSLGSISALSPTDIWAVGSGDNGSPLITHWQGTQWQVIPAPALVYTSYVLSSIVALSTDDVWAVGFASTIIPGYGGGARTLALHWDGTQWSQVPTPNPGSRTNSLQALTVAGPHDLWAVGSYANGIGYRSYTLIQHWNGLAWQTVPSPNPYIEYNILNSVAAAGPTDIWAVGWGTYPAYGAMTLHWDGSAWQNVPNGYEHASLVKLTGVVAMRDGTAWAVGRRDGNGESLTLRWDGTAWLNTGVPLPDTEFTAITATASGELWAVGFTAYQATAFHWQNNTWMPATIPAPGSPSWLYDIASLGTGDLWVVGATGYAGDPMKILTARYSDPCGPMPSPTVTGTPPTATATPSPAPTFTPCALSFSDVPPNNPFYPWIRCLACQGIISGYADNTFRPQSTLTRGQAAKILANAAQIYQPIPDGHQMFEDVPPSHPFWVYIERLRDHEAISGYACGGPGEPCRAGWRPYFRPAGTITRSQFAKIGALAAVIVAPIPPTQQTFADVPPGHPFWSWVEQLAGGGVIGGYTCGGTAEPCDPANRPYFRSGNEVTRAQAAKISSILFYATCAIPAQRDGKRR